MAIGFRILEGIIVLHPAFSTLNITQRLRLELKDKLFPFKC